MTSRRSFLKLIGLAPIAPVASKMAAIPAPALVHGGVSTPADLSAISANMGTIHFDGPVVSDRAGKAMLSIRDGVLSIRGDLIADGPIVASATKKPPPPGAHPDSDDGFCGHCGAFTRRACGEGDDVRLCANWQATYPTKKPPPPGGDEG